MTGGLDVLLYPQAEGLAGNQANCCRMRSSRKFASAEKCPATAATNSHWAWSDRLVARWFWCSPVKPPSHQPEEGLTVAAPEPRRCQTDEWTTPRMRKEIQWRNVFVAQSCSVESDRRSFALRQFLLHVPRSEAVQIVLSEAPRVRLESVRMRMPNFPNQSDPPCGGQHCARRTTR